MKKELYTNNYVITSDITQKLYKNFKANDFKDGNIMTEDYHSSRNQLAADFAEYKRRQYYLAITGIHWCPCKFVHSTHEESDDSGKPIRDYIALLGGCNKLGMFLIWKVSADIVTDALDIEYLTNIAVSSHQATTVAWHQDSPSSAGVSIQFVPMFQSLSENIMI